MRTEILINRLKDLRDNGECVSETLVLEQAIKSLEAWEKVKDQLSEQVHHNLDVKENFETGSTSRIECNTTASVLAGVIYLIDKHLSEVEK